MLGFPSLNRYDGNISDTLPWCGVLVAAPPLESSIVPLVFAELFSTWIKTNSISYTQKNILTRKQND